MLRCCQGASHFQLRNGYGLRAGVLQHNRSSFAYSGVVNLSWDTSMSPPQGPMRSDRVLLQSLLHL